MSILNKFRTIKKENVCGEKNIYRLYFVEYMKSQYTDGLFQTNWPSKPFTLPVSVNSETQVSMSREDAFKVISYLTDDVERHCPPFSLKAANTMNGVIGLERFGFTPVEETNEDNIIDLFTIGGRSQYFKSHKLYHKYFEWYIKGVTRKEVEEIYAKLGIEFKDIVWLDEKQKGRRLRP